MTSSTRRAKPVLWTSLFCVSSLLLSGAKVHAQQSVRFQRPSATVDASAGNVQFRSPNAETPPAQRAVVQKQQLIVAKPLPKRKPAPQPAKPIKVAAKQPAPVTRTSGEEELAEPELVEPDRSESVESYESDDYDNGYYVDQPSMMMSQTCDGCATCGMGICEPGCGCAEPSCGCYEPSCEIVEPGCDIVEPGCGIADVGCGSCIGNPGPDYWCFPVCLPRFKDLTVWSGVEGFRGPRDFAPDALANPRSDSNFGFNEGFNISGRAPFISLLFPELSYQFGYRAVQSRLDGTVDTTVDRSQDFLTAGLFRRVGTGLQFGVVWDMLGDDLDTNTDLQQVRYEVSVKTPRGREIGFLGSNGTNDDTSLGVVYEAVDQYVGFCRWKFGQGYECRLWGGATGDGEGLFGGEFYAALNDRWSVQSGFNYLIPEPNTAPAAVQEESWNIGIDVVWHMGATARRGVRSPFRPLFGVANNGSMFVDVAP